MISRISTCFRFSGMQNSIVRTGNPVDWTVQSTWTYAGHTCMITGRDLTRGQCFVCVLRILHRSFTHKLWASNYQIYISPWKDLYIYVVLVTVTVTECATGIAWKRYHHYSLPHNKIQGTHFQMMLQARLQASSVVQDNDKKICLDFITWINVTFMSFY